MDCKYAVPAETPEVYCKYTQGERLFDTTNPEEEQHAPFRHRAKVRIFPGNNCRLLFKNLPNGKSNFTCNIKGSQADSATATKTSVVEKSKLLLLTLVITSVSAVHILLFWHTQKKKCLSDKQNAKKTSEPAFCFLIAELLLPCSAWSVLLQSCSGLLLTLMTLPMLLEIHWLWTRRQTAAYVNTAPIMSWWLLVDSAEVVCMHKLQWVDLNVSTVYIWYDTGLHILHHALNSKHTYYCIHVILYSTLTYKVAEMYSRDLLDLSWFLTDLPHKGDKLKHEFELVIKLKYYILQY